MQALARILNPVQVWFAGLRQEKGASARQEEPVYQLDRILQVYARPRGPGEAVRLMTERVGMNCLLFRTHHVLQQGERLDVQLLLRSDLFLAVTATVAWVSEGEEGLRGQLDLEIPAEHRTALLSFLRQRGRPLESRELAVASKVVRRRDPGPQRRYSLQLPSSCPQAGLPPSGVRRTVGEGVEETAPRANPARRVSLEAPGPTDERWPELDGIGSASSSEAEVWATVARLLRELLPPGTAFRVFRAGGRGAPEAFDTLFCDTSGSRLMEIRPHVLEQVLQENRSLIYRWEEPVGWVAIAPVETRAGGRFLLCAGAEGCDWEAGRRVRLSLALLARSLGARLQGVGRAGAC